MRTLLANGRPGPSLRAVADSMRNAQLAYIERYRRWENLKPGAAALDVQRRRLTRQEDLLSTLVTRVLVAPDRELRDSTLRTLARRDSARANVATAQAATEEIARPQTQMDGLESRLARLAEEPTKPQTSGEGRVDRL